MYQLRNVAKVFAQKTVNAGRYERKTQRHLLNTNSFKCATVFLENAKQLDAEMGVTGT